MFQDYSSPFSQSRLYSNCLGYDNIRYKQEAATENFNAIANISIAESKFPALWIKKKWSRGTLKSETAWNVIKIVKHCKHVRDWTPAVQETHSVVFWSGLDVTLIKNSFYFTANTIM